MRTLDALWPLIGVGVLVVAVVVLMIVMSLVDSRRRRMMARTPATAIAATEPGQVAKVCGLVRRLDQVFTAPITGRPCLAYIVHIEQHERASQQGYSWTTWILERMVADLLLDDRTGTIRLAIDARAELELDYDREIESSTFATLDERIARFLQERGSEPPTGILLRRPVRCREYVLREGKAVAALGRVDVDSDRTGEIPPEQAHGERSLRHVLRQPSPKQPVVLSSQARQIDQKLLPETAETEISIDIDVDFV